MKPGHYVQCPLAYVLSSSLLLCMPECEQRLRGGFSPATLCLMRDARVSGWGFWQRDTMGFFFLRSHGPDFRRGFSHSACFSGIQGCLLNRSPNEAAAALRLITQQSMRPRDCAGLQTGLVVPPHISLIKRCVRRLDYHLRGYHLPSSLGISCCLCHESLLSFSTPATHYKFWFAQEDPCTLFAPPR